MAHGKCHWCSKTLYGRLDKKFCDQHCRNSYNNQRYRNQHLAFRPINAILRTNRTILFSILQESQQTQISRQDLMKKGFNFNYITHIRKIAASKSCYFCYDVGYHTLDNGYFAVVNIQDVRILE